MGIGTVLMGTFRIFGVFHKLAAAIEENTKGLAENTKRLEKVADKMEDHAERIIRLEAVAAITSVKRKE